MGIPEVRLGARVTTETPNMIRTSHAPAASIVAWSLRIRPHSVTQGIEWLTRVVTCEPVPGPTAERPRRDRVRLTQMKEIRMARPKTSSELLVGSDKSAPARPCDGTRPRRGAPELPTVRPDWRETCSLPSIQSGDRETHPYFSLRSTRHVPRIHDYRTGRDLHSARNFRGERWGHGNRPGRPGVQGVRPTDQPGDVSNAPRDRPEIAALRQRRLMASASRAGTGHARSSCHINRC
jgi:hypothetical protein